MTNEAPVVEEIAAASAAALALERARGVPIPKELASESTYKIGFAAGAMWAVEWIRENLR